MTSKSISGRTLAVLFILWYGCNAGYNVYNSFTKNDFAHPYAIALAQLAIGFVYVIPLWALGFRDTPKLTIGDLFSLLPIGKRMNNF